MPWMQESIFVGDALPEDEGVGGGRVVLNIRKIVNAGGRSYTYESAKL